MFDVENFKDKVRRIAIDRLEANPVDIDYDHFQDYAFSVLDQIVEGMAPQDPLSNEDVLDLLKTVPWIMDMDTDELEHNIRSSVRMCLVHGIMHQFQADPYWEVKKKEIYEGYSMPSQKVVGRPQGFRR